MIEMETKILLYTLTVWVVFVVLAIMNGAAREIFYAPRVGDHTGHIISSIIAIVYILIVTYMFVSRIKPHVSKRDLFLIGTVWLAMTIVFEFGFGHYIMGHSWSHLLADYNILEGKLWSLVLLTTFAAPSLWGHVMKG